MEDYLEMTKTLNIYIEDEKAAIKEIDEEIKEAKRGDFNFNPICQDCMA